MNPRKNEWRMLYWMSLKTYSINTSTFLRRQKIIRSRECISCRLKYKITQMVSSRSRRNQLISTCCKTIATLYVQTLSTFWLNEIWSSSWIASLLEAQLQVMDYRIRRMLDPTIALNTAQFRPYRRAKVG